jgi:hypothetical protein
MNNDQLINLLGAYLDDVNGGSNLQKMHLTGQWSRNYVTTAAIGMSLLTGTTPQYYNPATFSNNHIFTSLPT